MPPSVSVDAVVLTALALEFAAVRAHLSDVSEVVHKGTVYEVGRVGAGGPTVAVVEVGAGNVGASFETERAVEHFQPQAVLFVGVAGGVKDVDIGDVVAGTKVYGYESGKEKGGFRLRPDVASVSYALEQRARAVARAGAWVDRRILSGDETREAFDALVGPIAAGEKVIADTASHVYRTIRDHLGDTLAVEMEGIGVLRAARANADVESLVVRGISDLIDDKGLADSRGSQPVAAASAAAFAVEVLLALPPSSPLATRAALQSNVPQDAEALASSLYEKGPLHDDVWDRAGGDVGGLDLSGPGRVQWHRAFRTIQKGGGVALSALIGIMAQDYPRHASLDRLKKRL